MATLIRLLEMLSLNVLSFLFLGFFFAICSFIYIKRLRIIISVLGVLADPKPLEYLTVLRWKAFLSCYHWVGGSGRCPNVPQFSLLDNLFFDSSIKKMNFILTSANAHCQADLLGHQWAHIWRTRVRCDHVCLYVDSAVIV